MRVQVGPFLPAVHEAEVRRLGDRASPGRVIRRPHTVSRIGDLAPGGVVASA
jgi:hypothetical protein